MLISLRALGSVPRVCVVPLCSLPTLKSIPECHCIASITRFKAEISLFASPTFVNHSVSSRLSIVKRNEILIKLCIAHFSLRF